MSGVVSRSGKSLFKAFLIIQLSIVAVGVVSLPEIALATDSGTNRTCAGLDPTQGGAAYTPTGSEQFQITLADGDQLAYTTADPLNIAAPGSFTQNLTGPGVLNVTAATAGNWFVFRGSASTLQCTVAATTTTTESDNLAAQQDALSSLLMLHHANTMRIGVDENIDAGLSGAPVAPSVSANAFAASTRGMGAFSAFDGENAEQPLWNAWVRGRYSRYDGDGGAFDGGIADVFAGVDYRLSPGLLLGALVGVGHTDFDTLVNTTIGGFENDSLTIGLYAGAEVLDTIRATGSLSYTRSDYTNRSGAVRGSFDADRITVTLNLSGQYELAGAFAPGFIIEPTMEFMYASEQQEGYTDSAAVVHAGQTVNAGRLSLGPRLIAPQLNMLDGSIRPWIAALGEYDFSNQSPVANSGLPDLDSITSLRLTAGLDGHFGPGQLSLRGDLFGLGSNEYTGFGGSLGYQIPF